MSQRSSTSSTRSKESNPPAPEAKSDINNEEKEASEKSLSISKTDGESYTEHKKLRYPMQVFLIVVNEFCERFSYYGMRAVLTLYLHDVLLFDEDTSTVLYHAFVSLCYFSPLFGAIIADTYWGKFKTILILSIFYACGSILLSVSAIPNGLPQVPFSMVALVIIAVGTGGIKPCVASFGGDQFVRPQQDNQLKQFFSIFYFSVNAGSLISTLLTPVLREEVKCFSQMTCFPLAFGVPAILMIVAIVIFTVGKPLYTIKAPEGNIMADVCKCIGHAIKRKWNSKKTEKKKMKHWLDFASDKYDKQLIEDIKRVLRILVLYIPLPMFWALMEQQGSRWTFQATRLDGTLGSVTIKPDQMQVANSLLVLILVPLFEKGIYPLFSKCGLLTPLQRITVGGILAAVAFVLSGVIELQLEPYYPQIPAVGQTQLNFANSLNCNISLDVNGERHIISAAGLYRPFLDNIEHEISVTVDGNNCGSLAGKWWNGTLQGDSEKSLTVLITLSESELKLLRMEEAEAVDKSSNGYPQVRFAYNWQLDEGEIRLQGPENYYFQFNYNTSLAPSWNSTGQTDVQVVEPGTYKLLLPGQDEGQARELVFKQGGSYSVILQEPGNLTTDFVQMVVTEPNSINMLWMIPQYFCLTMGEVMFSVTGLQFSFTQAPTSMKAIVQSFWQLTNAIGNLIVIIVAEANGIPRQSMEFFLFAGLMGLAMVIFVLLALRYEYAEEDTKDQDSIHDKECKTEQDAGSIKSHENKAFEN